MNDFTTEIVQTLVTKGDLNELFRSHLEKAINTLLRTELTAFLDYEKYDRTGFNSGNSRNGSYFRSIKTEYGELTLEIPRDRNGEFKQQTCLNSPLRSLGISNVNSPYSVLIDRK
ncbi:hypothetical protein AS256_15435 [Enterococcus faecium]|nr:hypothetical protein AS256_15435 [Enterococcus faecium]